MKRQAGIVGCARKLLPVALILAIGLPCNAADRVIELRVPFPVAKGIDAMPRIAAPVDDAERRINDALPRLDGAVRKAVAECNQNGGKNYDWSRSVEATMRGPRFLSFTITDNNYCGGAHPNSSTMTIVYDLSTGKPVDWTMLLPPALTGKVSLSSGADGTRMVTLASAKLFELYLKLYRPKTAGPEANDDQECREAVTEAGATAPPPMMLWLDAKDRGLAVQFELPHVVQGCGDSVRIPIATLKAEGAKPVLTDALGAAASKAR